VFTETLANTSIRSVKHTSLFGDDVYIKLKVYVDQKPISCYIHYITPKHYIVCLVNMLSVTAKTILLRMNTFQFQIIMISK